MTQDPIFHRLIKRFIDRNTAVDVKVGQTITDKNMQNEPVFESKCVGTD